ncbi:MAG TPA: dihydrodipicolinate synthase family protein [Herbaspirillum sp.]|uniref:dihydrodipicolinate synthase family protein n=1 Tax=Herbaspirillum sp. TaxID=1890675 RepID=UPI002D2CC768|nr:dihydrodipicolinate synthase family protein [Herbaspirillum sp.]HZG20071.1 dihydrodipicolinate synthase family protein [Herbaspirillum sp.]
MSSLFLNGIIPPVVTPYTQDDRIDHVSLRKVIRHLLAGGVHGLFLLGSTSECVFLTPQQRAEVIEVALSEVGGRVPVVAGILDSVTDHCIAHARQAESLGVDGLVLTAPYYTRTSQGEIVDHFRYVRQAVDLPIIAYDIPVCVHIKLARDTIGEMYREQLICGLKDSSGDDGNLRMVMQDFAGHQDFSILTGSEIVADYALLGGAHGCVPGLGNVDPAGYVRLYDAARRGDWVAARQEQERLIRLFQIVFQGLPESSAGASGVGGFKTAMQMMGLIEQRHMGRPNRPLSDAAAEKVMAILIKSGLM